MYIYCVCKISQVCDRGDNSQKEWGSLFIDSQIIMKGRSERGREDSENAISNDLETPNFQNHPTRFLAESPPRPPSPNL
jgi:hypothetical protein